MRNYLLGKEVRLPNDFTGWRDATLFISGICLIIYEAVLREGPERPTLLILYAGMVGLPAFLKSDEKKESNKDA